MKNPATLNQVKLTCVGKWAEFKYTDIWATGTVTRLHDFTINKVEQIFKCVSSNSPFITEPHKEIWIFGGANTFITEPHKEIWIFGGGKNFHNRAS